MPTAHNNPEIYVTENGWSTSPDDGLMDDARVAYYTSALEQLLNALDDGVNLKSYMAWSLMDNYEWMMGYTERFGLYAVDFSSPLRTRTARLSAHFYKQVLRSRVVDPDYRPTDLTMTIDEGH